MRVNLRSTETWPDLRIIWEGEEDFDAVDAVDVPHDLISEYRHHRTAADMLERRILAAAQPRDRIPSELL